MVDGISWDDLLNQASEEVQLDSFEPIPEDDYELEVVEVKHSMTKTTPSKDMWSVQSKVVENANPKFNNRRLFDRLVLSPESPKALGIFFSQMAVMGLTKEYFSTKPTPEAIASALKGRRFRAKVIQAPYKGEMQNEIKRYKPSQSASAVATPPPGATPSGVPAPPVPGASPAAPQPPAPPAAPAPPAPPAPAPEPAAPAPAPASPPPAAPAPETPQAAVSDPWATPPAPAPAPALQKLPF